MIPRSITRTGRNHTWSAPMTDAQRERAEPRFYDEHGRPWTAWRVICDLAGMIALFGGLAVLWCVL